MFPRPFSFLFSLSTTVPLFIHLLSPPLFFYPFIFCSVRFFHFISSVAHHLYYPLSSISLFILFLPSIHLPLPLCLYLPSLLLHRLNISFLLFNYTLSFSFTTSLLTFSFYPFIYYSFLPFSFPIFGLIDLICYSFYPCIGFLVISLSHHLFPSLYLLFPSLPLHYLSFVS